MFLLLGGIYFLIGPGTFHELLSKLKIQFIGFSIATVLAVCVAWYFRKYHNALRLYRKDAREKEKAARRDPDNPAHAIPLASSYRAIAIALESQNKHTEAASYNSKADKVEQRLADLYGQLNKPDN